MSDRQDRRVAADLTSRSCYARPARNRTAVAPAPVVLVFDESSRVYCFRTLTHKSIDGTDTNRCNVLQRNIFASILTVTNYKKT